MTNSRREQVYRTEAIVIGRMDLGEADRILTLVYPCRRQIPGDCQRHQTPQEP